MTSEAARISDHLRDWITVRKRYHLSQHGIDVLGLPVIQDQISQDRLPQGARGTVPSVKHRLIRRWN